MRLALWWLMPVEDAPDATSTAVVVAAAAAASTRWLHILLFA